MQSHRAKTIKAKVFLVTIADSRKEWFRSRGRYTIARMFIPSTDDETGPGVFANIDRNGTCSVFHCEAPPSKVEGHIVDVDISDTFAQSLFSAADAVRHCKCLLASIAPEISAVLDTHSTQQNAASSLETERS